MLSPTTLFTGRCQGFKPYATTKLQFVFKKNLYFLADSEELTWKN